VERMDRRQFLRAAGAAGLALSWGLEPAMAGEEPRSRVVQVTSAGWRRAAGGVDGAAVRAMLDRGLMRLTGKPSARQAWRSLFSPGEVVGLKFNRISRDFTGANQALVDALAAGLVSAGVRKKDIIPVEAHGVKFAGGRPQPGWAGEFDFGSGKTRLSNFLVRQVDALINVPNLKHHPIVAFTGCLKNLSHANDTIMEGPNRFHGNNCDPYIADICALKELRGKVRLHVMNALKGIFARGAYPPAPEFQWFHNSLLLGFDPVAIDTLGAEQVDKARCEHEKRPLKRDPRALKYLATAATRGLGTNDPAQIELVSATL